MRNVLHKWNVWDWAIVLAIVLFALVQVWGQVHHTSQQSHVILKRSGFYSSCNEIWGDDPAAIKACVNRQLERTVIIEATRDE
jgi:hypothetical protein